MVAVDPEAVNLAYLHKSLGVYRTKGGSLFSGSKSLLTGGFIVSTSVDIYTLNQRKSIFRDIT